MKKARLEIRLTEDDKEFIKELAKMEGCTVTDVITDFITSAIHKLRYTLKSDDSGKVQLDA